MADEGEGLSAKAIRDLDDVRCVVDPSVRSGRGDFAQAAPAEVDAHQLHGVGIQVLREELEAHQVGREPGNREHQRCIRRSVPLGVHAP